MNSGTLARFILIALVFLLLSASPAHAATYNVSSQSEWNAAMTAAFSTSEDDIVNITASFTLSAKPSAIFSNLTVQGNGYTINGADQHPAITIATDEANVTINNLTLAENKGASGSNGGAILYTFGSSLTLNNVTIRESASAAANANGGGLYCTAANLTIRNSRINGNSANEGGGLYLGNGCTNAQIINSSIYDNSSAGGTVTKSGGGTRVKSGGGIHVAGGASVTISGSRIYGNTAGTAVAATTAGSGGGIGAYASSSSVATVNINSSSIYNNQAYSQGGGLYMNGRTTLNVSGSAFYGNDAKESGASGGGLALKNESGSAATHTITNTSIFNNTGSGRGAGIYASMNFQGTTSVVTLRHVTISGNTTSLTGTTQGGGLHVVSAKVTLQNSIVFGNTADGSASNCIFSGLPTPSQSAQLTPSLSGNIIGGGSQSSNPAHCKADSVAVVDPQLAASASGNPPYLNLRAGSPAIDGADCLSGVTTDQRGRTRPNPASTDGKCDIGAIEWYAPPPAPPGSDVGDVGGPGGSSGSASRSGSQGVAQPAAVPVIRYSPEQSCQTLQPDIVVSKASSGTSCQLVSGSEIGHPDVIAANPSLVVDLWGWVTPGTQVCFLADSGAIRFIDTTAIPRTVADLPVFSEPGGLLCATIDGAGQVALVAGPSAPAPQQQAASAQGTMLSDCMVLLQYALNFRDAPDGEMIAVLPSQVKLTALERADGWFKVDYHGEQGWISAAYVEPEGDCG